MAGILRWHRRACAGFACVVFLLSGEAAWAAPQTTASSDFSFAQPKFDKVGDNESIPEGAVTALAQDTRGLLWIGSQAGLIRYDGYQFRRFTHDKNDPVSLPSNNVSALLSTKDGLLWVGSNSDGLSVFDPGSERFEHFKHNPRQPNSLSAGRISALLSDAKGGLWIATEQGLDYLPRNGKEFIHYRHQQNDPGSLLDDRVRRLLLSKDGRFWVGTRLGLQRMTLDGKGFERIAGGAAANADGGPAGAINIQTLFEAQDGKLWVGTAQHGAAWIAPNSIKLNWLPLNQAGQTRNDALSHAWISSIVPVHGNQLWIGTYGGGINVADADGKIVQHLHHDPALENSLALDFVSPMLIDRAGIVWIGTWGGGLQRYNGKDQLVRLLWHGETQPLGLSHPSVQSILELADGRILIGSDGNGIDIIDRQRGLIGGYRAAKDALPDASITALAQTADGTLWVGTQQGGVVRMPPGGKTWQSVPGLPGHFVRCFLVARDGSLWVGTGYGVARWQAGQAQFQTIPDEDGKPMQRNVWALVEDTHGRIWAGSNYGLWLMEPGHAGLHGIFADDGRAHGLLSNATSSLTMDSHDRLWVSTDKGLQRLSGWDGKEAQFEDISTLLGRSGELFGGDLLEDKAGRLWAEGGVIDPVKMRIAPFGKAEGLDVGSARNGSIAKTRDGMLLFGGTQGLAIVNPALFKAWDGAPPVVVIELKINGKSIKLGKLSAPQTDREPFMLTLAPNQRDFSVEFAALDYSGPKNIRYQYRLLGYDNNWIDTDFTHRAATYGNLWPGTYTLQVRGSNRVGEWSPNELRIQIEVLPAWHQTWWFALLAFAVLAAGIFELIHARTRSLRQRQHELEQQVKERTLDLKQANTELHLAADTLRQLGDIGREITGHLDQMLVFQALYEYVNGLLDTQVLSIYRMNNATQMLNMMFGREGDAHLPRHAIALDSPISNVARAARDRQELLRNLEPDVVSHNQVPGTRKMCTALFAPLVVDDRLLGVMSIQSVHQHAYGERERLIFRTLCAYGAIALANADSLAALQQAQAQLVQQEKLASLGGLVAGIAHEINTPLGTTLLGISGAAAVWERLRLAIAGGRLSKSMLDTATEDGIEYTALANRNATRTAELIRTFKTIALHTDGDRKSNVDIVHFIPEVTSLVIASLKTNGVELKFDMPSSLPVNIVSDALMEVLTRVLTNLLDHAFCDGKTGAVQIRAAVEEQQMVLIEIADNGHGIDAADLPKVFDPFFTTKSGSRGHIGLGLHVAYNHVTQRLNGQIEVVSAPGRGTTVKIRFKSA